MQVLCQLPWEDVDDACAELVRFACELPAPTPSEPLSSRASCVGLYVPRRVDGVPELRLVEPSDPISETLRPSHDALFFVVTQSRLNRLRDAFCVGK